MLVSLLLIFVDWRDAEVIIGLGKWVEIGNSGMFRLTMLLPMGLSEGLRVYGFGLPWRGLR